MSYDFIPLDFRRLEPEEQRRRAVEFYELMRRRRVDRLVNPPINQYVKIVEGESGVKPAAATSAKTGR
jgi:hypothetical protein